MRLAEKLIRSRDHIFAVASLSGFGVYNFFSPSPSLAALHWYIQIACYIMFVISGIALLGGYLANSFETYVLGHVLAIANLITVALVVFFTTFSPVALLVFGFAVALSASLQKLLIERRMLRALRAETGEFGAVSPGDN